MILGECQMRSFYRLLLFFFFLSFFPWIARERRCCWSQVSNYGDVAQHCIPTHYKKIAREISLE